MIGRFHVENFKCLRDVTVDFAPFTVLIGPNDSGKSSLLQAIDEVSTIFGGTEIDLNRSYNQLVWRRDPERNILWDLVESISNTRFHMCVSGASDRATLKNDVEAYLNSIKKKQYIEDYGWVSSKNLFMFDLGEAWQTAAERILTDHPYKFHPDALRKMSPPEPSPTLNEEGSNLAAVLDAMLTGPDRAGLRELEHNLYQTIPTLRGISAPTVFSQLNTKQKIALKALQFVLAGKEHPPITIPASLVSDGALLLTAYLVLAYGDTPEVILIEEPENGLHPSRLKMIIDLLRKMTTGEVGNRKRQVIITTHSPLLLNYCQPEEVRIVTRDAEGATQVTPLTDVPDIRRLLEEFGIGELWYLLGEEALLKGKAP